MLAVAQTESGHFFMLCCTIPVPWESFLCVWQDKEEEEEKEEELRSIINGFAHTAVLNNNNTCMLNFHGKSNSGLHFRWVQNFRCLS